MAKKDSQQNQREHYRIRYPDLERPEFLVGKQKYPVLDVSERGIRVKLPMSHVFVLGQIVKGIVKFRSGKQVAIEGRIIRITQAESSCSVQLRRSIPLAYIMEEQRLLLQRYNEL